MAQKDREVVYTTTGETQRGEVSNYHRKPNPLNLNKAFPKDIKGLKKKDEVFKITDDEVASRFTIGFEVEKNRLSRGAVKEYPLFCGFERDSSCGYEAVSHILPLLPASKWRNKVFNMLHQAERIIDDRWSPSDKSCGGHISIGVEGLTGCEIMQQIRKNSGIILALFRKRLDNRYCGGNKRMSYFSYYDKYSVAFPKDYCLEFRLPSRVESVKQLIRRYELFYEIVNFTFNVPNGKHDTLLKRIKPIILSMYNGDEDKTKEILELAKDFRKFIVDGDISDSIRGFL